MKNSLMREWRGVEGLTVMPIGASAATAVNKMSVLEMPSTTKTWVHETTFELGSAILTCAVEFSGQVFSKFQRSVSDGKTQRVNAGSRKATAKRWFRSAKW